MPKVTGEYPSTIYLEHIPREIFEDILDEQSDFRKSRGVTLNLSKTVIKMLRDYSICKKQNNFKPE